MARYDDSTRQIVVRIIYDGAGTAGKTTNLEQLTQILTRSRRGELISKETTRGRTLFFDWLQLQGGLIGGYNFRCELLTVPGQEPLRRRRQHLLDSADVVVLVVDSTEAGVSEGKSMLSQLQDCVADREVPIIVQANKQDLPGAASPERLRELMALPEAVPVVAAEAARGAGVRDTALLAMRQAAVSLHGVVLDRGVSLFPPVDETPETLMADMKMLRIEALPAESLEALPAESLEALPAESFEALEASAAGGPPGPDLLGRAPPLSRSSDAPADRAPDVVTVVPERSVPEPLGPSRSQPPPALPFGGLVPPRPSARVISRHIWPAASGRELLRELEDMEPVLCPELMHKQGKQDGSGKPDTLIYRSGQCCLKTSPRRRYGGTEEGERALVDLARAKVMLGDLLVPSTVLVLQEDDKEGLWLWTICPWTPSLRSDMEAAERVHANAALGGALARYAEASFAALKVLRDKQLVLDISPSNFAVQKDVVVYLDDDIARGEHCPSLGYAWLKRVDEYAAAFDAVERYVAVLEDGIKRELRPADVARWDLTTAIDQTLVSSEAGRDAKLRLVAAARQVK